MNDPQYLKTELRRMLNNQNRIILNCKHGLCAAACAKAVGRRDDILALMRLVAE